MATTATSRWDGRQEKATSCNRQLTFVLLTLLDYPQSACADQSPFATSRRESTTTLIATHLALGRRERKGEPLLTIFSLTAVVLRRVETSTPARSLLLTSRATPAASLRTLSSTSPTDLATVRFKGPFVHRRQKLTVGLLSLKKPSRHCPETTPSGLVTARPSLRIPTSTRRPLGSLSSSLSFLPATPAWAASPKLPAVESLRPPLLLPTT